MDETLMTHEEDEIETPMRLAREWTLQFLYRWDVSKDVSWEKELNLFLRECRGSSDQEKFVQAAVHGVANEVERWDGIIQQSSPHWKLNRMGAIDRNLLRLGTWELFLQAQTPREVIVNEAVVLAKKYGSEDSARFVNGILQEIWKRLDASTAS